MYFGGTTERKLKWCFKIKDGAKFVRPSKPISDSYITLAKNSLKRAEFMLKEKDFLWATVLTYYAEYYAISSFLARIGIKCENHFCSILISKFLLGEEKVSKIEDHRGMRIDAQYYLKISNEKKIKEMLLHAKIFVSEIEEILSSLNEEKISSFQNKIKEFLK